MRTRLLGLALATLAGASLGACQLVLGISDRDTGTGARATGGAASSTSTTTESSSSGRGGTTGTGADAGDGGDAEAGPPPRGVWAISAAAEAGAPVTATAIAVGSDHHVFVTGKGVPSGGLTCAMAVMADPNATGYLVELDPKGNCLWGFFFGQGATGTGVAVDALGNVALTGTFTGGTIDPSKSWFVQSELDSFVVAFDTNRSIAWSAQIGDFGPGGSQLTTSADYRSGTVAVAGSYTNSLGVNANSGPMGIAMISNKADAFALWFDATTGKLTNHLLITSPNAMTDQVATGVALDKAGQLIAVAGTTIGATQFNGPPDLPASMNGNAFLAAYDTSKSSQFQPLIFGGGDPQDGKSVAYDANTNLFMTGDFSGALVPAGTGIDGGTAIMSSGAKDVFVASYDAHGLFRAITTFGSGTQDTTIAGAAPHANGSTPTVAIAGTFLGNPKFPDGTGLVNGSGNTKVYVAQLDSALSNVLWLDGFGDGQGQEIDALAVDPVDGSILVAGRFVGTLDFGGAATVTNGGGAAQLFVAKLNP